MIDDEDAYFNEDDELEEQDEGEESAGGLSPEAVAKREQKEVTRKRILGVIAAGNPKTAEEKVAWILNHHRHTRNSDIELMFVYWSTFETFSSYNLTQDDLRRLPRLTTLARARAKIQNYLKLFLADPEVRAHRGTLSEEEKVKARKAKEEAFPIYSIYIDESGKTSTYLLVGSVWILDGQESFRMTGRLGEWRAASKYKRELHFKDLKPEDLPSYKAAFLAFLGNGSAVSVKYISVLRAGVGNVQDALLKMTYHLVAQGIEHEHASGRAPLPRNLQLWMDATEASADKMGG